MMMMAQASLLSPTSTAFGLGSQQLQRRVVMGRNQHQLMLLLKWSGSSPSTTLLKRIHSKPRSTVAIASVSDDMELPTTTSKKVAIVGGGLAGLSTAYHLLHKTNQQHPHHEQEIEITIFDTKPVGTGGASAVAGGLLHPLSPRGKLVYLGLEGLAATNRLVDAASRHFVSTTTTTKNDEALFATTHQRDVNDHQASVTPESPIVLQDSVHRVALSMEEQVALQTLADQLCSPGKESQVHCQWLSPDELNVLLDDSWLVGQPHDRILITTGDTVKSSSSSLDVARTHFGALRMSGHAKVIHVPSYLCGLWNACLYLSNKTAKWSIVTATGNDDDSNLLTRLSNEFDIVVLAAGAGLFQPSSESSSNITLESSTLTSSILSPKDFPVQLVRGQAVEFQQIGRAGPSTELCSRPPALVCGKYIFPALHNGRILVGATHESQSNPWSIDIVLDKLRERTMFFLPSIWQNQLHEEGDDNKENVDWIIAEVTRGMRVQTNRIGHGRLPIIGHLHSNVWIFTGLSSRGLLYHALLGDYLTDSILLSLRRQDDQQQQQEELVEANSEWNWWKKRKSPLTS